MYLEYHSLAAVNNSVRQILQALLCARQQIDVINETEAVQWSAIEFDPVIDLFLNSLTILLCGFAICKTHDIVPHISTRREGKNYVWRGITWQVMKKVEYLHVHDCIRRQN